MNTAHDWNCYNLSHEAIENNINLKTHFFIMTCQDAQINGNATSPNNITHHNMSTDIILIL